MRPTEYTAALIEVLRRHAAAWRDASVLDVGCGSGVILAVLGSLGAARLCGVDIEEAAIAATASLLATQGLSARSDLYRGDMWAPVAGRRFDLVTANLPHFPMERGLLRDRLPSWSAGGRDGRRLLDPFLEALSAHLAPDGRAFVTHNAFVGLERTRLIAQRHDLTMTVAGTTVIHIPPDKLERLTPSVLRAEEGRTIHRYGPHAFAEMHIVELRPAGSPGPG